MKSSFSSPSSFRRHVRTKIAPFLAVVATLLAGIVSVNAQSPISPPATALCAQFGERLAARLNEGHTGELGQTMDSAAFMKLVLARIGLTPQEERDFTAGFVERFGETLEQEFGKFASAKFVRVEQPIGETRVLLRFLDDSGGASYVAFICEPRPSGGVHWVDTFSYTTGDRLSESTRRLVLPALAEMRTGLAQQMPAAAAAYLRSLPHLQTARLLTQQNQPAQALAELQKIPAAQQRERYVLMARLGVAQAMSNDEYRQVLKEWEGAHPQDPAPKFLAIDGHLLRGDHAGALRSLEAFKQLLGGDAYLDFLTANIRFMAGDHMAARRAARAALAAEPMLHGAYDTLLTLSLTEEKFDETAAILTDFEKQFPHADMAAAIADDDVYAKFRRSAAYRSWIAKRGSKAGGQSPTAAAKP